MTLKELIDLLSTLDCEEVEIYTIKNKTEYVIKHDEILKCEEDFLEEIK